MPATRLRRVGIVPAVPALLPGATGRASDSSIEDLRVSVRDIVDWLVAGEKPLVIAYAADDCGVTTAGNVVSARAFGLPGEFSIGAVAAPCEALATRAAGLVVGAALIGPHATAAIGCGDLDEATQLLRGLDPASILVVGGGSARRRDGAPGYIDERAVPYDDALARQLAQPRMSELSRPDVALAHELLADLPTPLAVAARLFGSEAPTGEVTSYAAPFGVAYYTARWWTDD